MRINIKKLLKKMGITEMLYPGKRFVKACIQAGSFKSHSVVIDWRDPNTFRVDVKAGAYGHSLDNKELHKYPVSLQSPTYVKVKVSDEDEDEEGGRGKASGGSGGRRPKPLMNEAFGETVKGKIPELGEVMEMVVMGTELAGDKIGKALDVLSEQVAKAKVIATDILSATTDMVTRYTPPAFMQPTGDEQMAYCYDREKNQDIGRAHFNSP